MDDIDSLLAKSCGKNCCQFGVILDQKQTHWGNVHRVRRTLCRGGSRRPLDSIGAEAHLRSIIQPRGTMRRWIAPSIVLVSLVITAIVFPRLPATIPTHWN